jgi:ABC-type Fe3+-hydroxamate transport system substrate-binding protein
VTVAFSSVPLLSQASPARPEAQRTFRDGVGRSVRIPYPPSRIVSFAPSVTETLFALGAGPQVVGVTDFCDYPPQASTLPRIGGMVNPNWEAVVALRPDLIVATTAGNDSSVIRRADSLHLPVYFMDAPDLTRLLGSLSAVAEAIGRPAEGRSLENRLRTRLSLWREAPPGHRRPKVLFLVWADPLVVPGKGTFLNDVLDHAGFDSITADAPPGWPTLDLESILLRRPDWILAAEHNAPALASIRNLPGWKDLEAVQEGRLVTANEAIERPSPRVIEAMEELRERVSRGQDD